MSSASRWIPALHAVNRALTLTATSRVRKDLWRLRLGLLSKLGRHTDVISAIESTSFSDREDEAFVAQHRAAALSQMGRRPEAIEMLRAVRSNPHLSADMHRAVAQADSAWKRSDSWVGFWFGADVSTRRKALGAALLGLAALFATVMWINPARVSGLEWCAGGMAGTIPLTN